MADLEYRMNIVTKVITDVIWYLAQLSFFEVMFRKMTTLSGWDLPSIRVFMGVLFLADALWMLLFWENLDNLSEKVKRGELDLLLVKPVNSLFMLSFKRINSAYLGNIVLVCIWLVWALQELPGGFDWSRLPLLLIMIPCGLALQYGMRFFFAAQAVKYTQADNLNYVWYQLYRLGTRPDTIYPQIVRYVVLSFLPVAFIASVPARILLSAPDYTLVLWAVFLATVSVSFSIFYWKHVLKFYSSASS